MLNYRWDYVQIMWQVTDTVCSPYKFIAN